MRVGVIGGTGPDELAAHIGDGLREDGHEVFSAELALPRTITRDLALRARQALPGLDQHAQRRLARALVRAECEVVINIDGRILPGIVAGLRSHGMKVAFWFPDAVCNLGRALMVAGPYDALFFKDPHVSERLGAFLETPVYYLPEACNPAVHRPAGNVGDEPFLVIAGNMYPSRVRVLERLAAKGIPLALYGAGFPRWLGDTPLAACHRGRAVFGADKARVYRSAAGVLNNLHPAELAGLNARLFEAAGCGAAVLTEYRPALPGLFAPEQEVLAFADFDQLVSQAERLLAGPALGARLGDAAAARARRDHTYAHRTRAILEKLA